MKERSTAVAIIASAVLILLHTVLKYVLWWLLLFFPFTEVYRRAFPGILLECPWKITVIVKAYGTCYFFDIHTWICIFVYGDDNAVLTKVLWKAYVEVTANKVGKVWCTHKKSVCRMAWGDIFGIIVCKKIGKVNEKSYVSLTRGAYFIFIIKFFKQAWYQSV